MSLREWINSFPLLWRSETGSGSKYPFYATDLRFISGYEGPASFVIIDAKFNKVLEAKDKSEASRILGIPPPKNLGSLVPGRTGQNEANMLDFDKRMAAAAEENGFDAIYLLDSQEVQIIKMGSNKPREWGYNDEDMPALKDTGEVI